MTRTIWRFFAPFALAMTGAGTVHAATVLATGSFGANSPQESFFGQTSLGPGTYRFSFKTTTPVLAQDLLVEKSTLYTYFCNDGSDTDTFPDYQCGSDVVYEPHALSLITPLLYQATLTVLPDYSQPGGPPPYRRYDQTDVCCNYSFNFGTINAGSYALSVSAFPETGGAVPEPATWALMILGIGIAGAAMRRRGASLATVL